MKSKIQILVSLALFVLFFSPNMFGQKIADDKVPPSVKTAFAQKFPTAQKAKWELEKGTIYEVNFKQNDIKWSANFDANGAFLESETPMKLADLPPSVSTALKSQFPNFKIDEVEKVTFADGTIAYEMEIEKGKEEYEVQFSADGKLLKKEVEGKE